MGIDVISIERNYAGDITPTVTIVLPCYNYADYLPAAMQSIAGQTFQGFEVIIVNDGSTDNTLEVARELLQEYRGRLCITLIDQENQGHPSATRNTGYSYAKGKYYFALDSDDMIKPEYVAKAVEMFEEHPDVDVVYPGYQTFGDTDWFHIPPDFDFDSLKYWDYIPYSSVFRREVFERIGGYDTSPSLRIMEDWDFWLRAYREGFGFRPIKEALLLHRTHQGSLLSSHKNKPFFAANVRLNSLSLFDEFDMEWARRILNSAEIRPYTGGKILVIVDHFPPDVGGAERFAAELGQEFAGLGFLVDVATLNLDRYFFSYNGLNIFEFDYPVGPYVPGVIPEFDKLQEFVEKGDYDLIIIKGGIRNWAIWSLDEPEQYPSVFVPIVNRETIAFLSGEEDTRKKLVKRLKSARVVVSLTESGHDSEFYCENDIPFEVIPNAVDFVSPTVDFRREMGIPSDAKLLLCVGSYYEIKNQLWLIESLRNMPGNWVLVTMGQVISESYYLRILNEARGDHRFLVLPPQGKGVVAAAMEQADLLLLPSQAEAFGRVALEAMSHRLPWIASTNCSGLKEVKGGSLAQLEREFDRGIISPKKRGKAVEGVGLLKSPFVEEIRRLLSDPVERERMGEEGRQEWKSSYRWQDFAGRYLDAIGLTPDPSRTAFFRRNTIEPEPARPDFIDFLRVDKKELPLVSVVLVTYNRPELLKTAIGSVLDQTYEDFEVMVVNDGGPDISQIIEQFDDSRITYIHNNRNMGPAGARNVAISMSRGKYIAYLDDDDIYYPTHLEALVDAIESSEAQVAYTDSYAVTMIKENGRWGSKSKELIYSEDFDRDFLFAYNIVPIICVMHDTKLFMDAGGFDEGLRCLEDWDLWIRMGMLCDFKHVREITCEVSQRMDRSRRSHDIQADVAVVTRAINGKYDGQVYRARDTVNKDIQSLLRRLETMKNYSLTDALSYLEDCLETYTESPRLEHMCAQIYRGQKDWGKTKYHLERCLKLDPGNRQASEDLAEASRELRESGGKVVLTPGLPDRGIKKLPEGGSLEVSRKTPIVVPVMRSGEGARAILKQLDTVTDNYSLVIVNNGLRDSDYLEGLDPRHCIETPIDMGIAGSINRALELLGEEYIAVLRSDVLLYDEGWLENIVNFLRRRTDVGLVGIAGWHSITEEGVPDLLTPVFKLRGHPDSNKPTWRFTEVAAIDDAGWVMRNAGFKLSEDYCDTSLFALDLSLKYIEAGFRVYVAAVEFAYAEDREDIARRFALAQTDHGEDMYGMREEARLAMRTKWEGLLPLTRGFYDEAYVMNKVEELADIRKHYLNIQRHARNLEADLHSRVEEIEKITRHARKLEVDIAAKDDAVKHITEHERQLERALATSRTARLKNFVRRRLGKESLKGK